MKKWIRKGSKISIPLTIDLIKKVKYFLSTVVHEKNCHWILNKIIYFNFN